MRRIDTFFGLILGSSLLLGGCFSDGAMPMGDGTDGMGDSDDDTAPMDDDDAPPTPGTTGTTGPEPTGADPTGEDPTGDPPDVEYEFDESDPDDYTQVDRMGMPAINTAVISDKDIYNASGPADDATGMFVEQIEGNLSGLHAALDDDLMGADLVPCPIGQCLAQAGPLVVPDTLKIDLQQGAGFPNGRLPSDPVMDVTLAVVLLDLTVEGQTALSLVGVNPTANDREFSDEFPYFAAPHQ